MVAMIEYALVYLFVGCVFALAHVIQSIRAGLDITDLVALPISTAVEIVAWPISLAFIIERVSRQ